MDVCNTTPFRTPQRTKEFLTDPIGAFLHPLQSPLQVLCELLHERPLSTRLHTPLVPLGPPEAYGERAKQGP